MNISNIRKGVKYGCEKEKPEVEDNQNLDDSFSLCDWNPTFSFYSLSWKLSSQLETHSRPASLPSSLTLSL